MASVSNIVRNLVNGNKLLHEAACQGILNYAAAAEKIKERVEKEFGRPVKESAIVMAIRRYSETTAEKEEVRHPGIKTEVIMKTGIAYLSFSKMPDFLEKLETFYRELDPRRDIFNVIQGNYETAIITNGRYLQRLKKLLETGSISVNEKELVSVSINFAKEFSYSPGIIFSVTKKLYWEGLNIFELITTPTELTFLFHQKDAMKAYSAINEMLGS